MKGKGNTAVPAYKGSLAEVARRGEGEGAPDTASMSRLFECVWVVNAREDTLQTGCVQ